jgi:hypothetical protein
VHTSSTAANYNFGTGDNVRRRKLDRRPQISSRSTESLVELMKLLLYRLKLISIAKEHMEAVQSVLRFIKPVLKDGKDTNTSKDLQECIELAFDS